MAIRARLLLLGAGLGHAVLRHLSRPPRTTGRSALAELPTSLSRASSVLGRCPTMASFIRGTGVLSHAGGSASRPVVLDCLGRYWSWGPDSAPPSPRDSAPPSPRRHSGMRVIEGSGARGEERDQPRGVPGPSRRVGGSVAWSMGSTPLDLDSASREHRLEVGDRALVPGQTPAQL